MTVKNRNFGGCLSLNLEQFCSLKDKSIHCTTILTYTSLQANIIPSPSDSSHNYFILPLWRTLRFCCRNFCLHNKENTTVTLMMSYYTIIIVIILMDISPIIVHFFTRVHLRVLFDFSSERRHKEENVVENIWPERLHCVRYNYFFSESVLK